MKSSQGSSSSVALVVASIAIGMFGLAYASVPLYQLFCRVTGFGGTMQTATKAPDHVLDERMTVRFNADIAPDLPLTFSPSQPKMDVRIGEQALVFFTVENPSTTDAIITATYNVTPSEMGAYLNKIQCFCYEKQTIKAGQKMRFPVTFFVDPAMMNDRQTAPIRTITLSYTFFRAKEQR